jgi:hypothetical protein
VEGPIDIRIGGKDVATVVNCITVNKTSDSRGEVVSRNVQLRCHLLPVDIYGDKPRITGCRKPKYFCQQSTSLAKSARVQCFQYSAGLPSIPTTGKYGEPFSIHSDTLTFTPTGKRFYSLLLIKVGNKEEFKRVRTFEYPYTDSLEGLTSGDQEVITIV